MAGAASSSSAADTAITPPAASATGLAGTAEQPGVAAQSPAPAELAAGARTTVAGALPDSVNPDANNSVGATLKQIATTNVAHAADTAARSDATSRTASTATDTATTPLSALNAAEAAKPVAADSDPAVAASQVASIRGAVARSAASSGASAAASGQALTGAGADATPVDASSVQPPGAPFQLDVAAVLGAQDKHARGGNDSLSTSVPPSLGIDAANAASGTAAGATAGSGFVAATGFSLAAPALGASQSAPALNTPEFTQVLGERVNYLVDNNLNGATLQVSPPQLGPIELRVTVEAGHAQVWMSAHNPATLDALQNSSGKLREMLSSQGFAQVSVDISQRSFQDNTPYSQNRPWTPPADTTAGTPATVQAAALGSARMSDAALDAYA